MMNFCKSLAQWLLGRIGAWEGCPCMRAFPARCAVLAWVPWGGPGLDRPAGSRPEAIAVAWMSGRLPVARAKLRSAAIAVTGRGR